MEIRNKGEELTKDELAEIRNNFEVTNHAEEMLKKRLINSKRVSIRKLLREPLIAYFNTDGSINVALDKFHYAVFVWDSFQKVFKVVTWKEESWYGKDIFQKQELAKLGITRK